MRGDTVIGCGTIAAPQPQATPAGRTPAVAMEVAHAG
jgi:hypothetical protein